MPATTTPAMTLMDRKLDAVPSLSWSSTPTAKNGTHPCRIPTPVVNMTNVGKNATNCELRSVSLNPCQKCTSAGVMSRGARFHTARSDRYRNNRASAAKKLPAIWNP